MNRRRLIMSLIIIFTAAILTPNISAAVVSPRSTEVTSQGTGTNVACGQPTRADREICEQMEERMLNATVRFRIDSWIVRDGDSGYDIDTSYGHATLKDDRYLVTHNHFGLPLSNLYQDRGLVTHGMVTLFDRDGKSLFKGPLSDFEQVWEDPETLVIGSKDDDLFTALGFQSADFESWASLRLEPGVEVAQVDWDGLTTRVDWTVIEAVTVEDGVPQLSLDDGVMPGASGGGVFWQGIHVANNWQLVQHFGASGEVANSYAIAALNGQIFPE